MHSLVYFSTMAHWLTTILCLFFCLPCVWSGVIHFDAAVNAEHDFTIDTTNDPLLNIPDGNTISKTTSDSNVTPSVVKSVTDINVSGKFAVTDETFIFNHDTAELSATFSDLVKESATSTSSNTLNAFGSAEGETVIDKNSSVPVLVEPDVIGNDTTQTTTGIKSTERFSSQILPDSPMPTLSPVTNSSLVVKESVTMADAEKNDNTNNNTASSNVDVKSSNTNNPTDMLITVVEETRIASDDLLKSDTTTFPDATDESTLESFTPPTVNAGIVQDLTVLTNTTDGFDLIMDNTIDSSINVGSVQFNANGTIYSKVPTNVPMTSGDSEVTFAGELNFDSSVDNAIETPVSSTLQTTEINGDSSTVSPLETLLFETSKETTLSTAFPSTSGVTNSAGSSLSTELDSISETTTSGENLINPPIQPTEQFIPSAVTVSTATNLNPQSTDKSASPKTESSMLTTTVSVLPYTSSQALSTESSTKTQMEVTKSTDESTPTAADVKSEVSVPKPDAAFITETTTLLRTSTTAQEPVDATTESVPSTTPERKSTTDETRKSTTSETPSLVVEPTSEMATAEATTPRATVENTVEIAIQPAVDNTVQTSKQVTTTVKVTTPQPTTASTVETTGRMTTNKDTSETKTTVVTTTIKPMIITADTPSPTTVTTAATSTVSTTERPCPEYQSRYNRNDLIVTTEPAGCTMISKIVDLRGRFRGPKRMIWRKMHSGLRGLRYPSVSFNYEGAGDVSDEVCQMPTKSVGPYIVVDTIPGRCQMVIGLRSIRAPINKNTTPGTKGSARRAFRFRLVMRPVVEYLEDTLL